MPEESISRVSFGEAKDFKFKAAYETYLRCFEKASGDDAKNTLNGVITKLFNGEITYSNFYYEINRYLEGVGESREFLRPRIEGQRKREYRRSQQKTESIKRHRR